MSQTIFTFVHSLGPALALALALVYVLATCNCRGHCNGRALSPTWCLHYNAELRTRGWVPPLGVSLRWTFCEDNRPAHSRLWELSLSWTSSLQTLRGLGPLAWLCPTTRNCSFRNSHCRLWASSDRLHFECRYWNFDCCCCCCWELREHSHCRPRPLH